MRSFLVLVSLSLAALSLLACDALPICGEEGTGEAQAKCGPCVRCEALSADELTEEEKAGYDLSWQTPPEWILGKWSGAYAGGGTIPPFEITGTVTDTSEHTAFGAKFYAPRRANDECDAELAEPCPQTIQVPVQVSWTITTAKNDYLSTGWVYLEGDGKTVSAPEAIPWTYASVFEDGRGGEFWLGFDPEGKLWLVPRAGSGRGTPVVIGARETAPLE